MSKNKIFTIISVLVLCIAIIGGTIAFFRWEGEESQISLTVSSGTGSCNKISDNNISLVPTSDKENGRIIKLTANQLMANKAYIVWNLVVNDIDGLQDESFKYQLINTTTGTIYGEGDFSNITAESNTIAFSSNELLDYQVNYEFILYLWIDGSFENPISMAGQEFDFDINCSISSSVITLDSNDAESTGTTSLYYKEGSIYLDNTLTVEMTTTDNPITIPTKTGYTFD